jgi:hypothetical protein
MKHVLWCESTFICPIFGTARIHGCESILLFDYEVYLMKVIPETRCPFWYEWCQLIRTDDWTGAPKYKDFNLFTYEIGEVWENPQALVARNYPPPPLLTFLFTYLFSIKFLYFFIISSFFPYFNLFVSIFIQSYASTKPIYCWHLWEKCELDFQKWEKCEQMPPMRSYLIVGIW